MINNRNPLSQEIQERLINPADRARYFPDHGLACKPAQPQATSTWWSGIESFIKNALSIVGLANDDIIVDVFMRTPHGVKYVQNVPLHFSPFEWGGHAKVQQALDEGQLLDVKVSYDGGRPTEATLISWKLQQQPVQQAVADASRNGLFGGNGQADIGSNFDTSQGEGWGDTGLGLPGPKTPRFDVPAAHPMAVWKASINRVSAVVGLDANLLAAFCWVESHGHPSALSGAGAQGLMQIEPGTFEEYYKKFTAKYPDINLPDTPYNPQTSLYIGAFYAKSMISQYSGTDRYKLGIAAYNAGPGAVAEYNGVPPYSETQAYVKKVAEAWGMFQQMSSRASLHPFARRTELQRLDQSQAHLQTGHAVVKGGGVKP